MTPEQFLNKWLPQAAEWLNVHPEALRMKDDLEAVIRGILTLEEYQYLLDRREAKVDLDTLKFRKERPDDFKEIGPDNWKFFGDYDSPSI